MTDQNPIMKFFAKCQTVPDFHKQGYLPLFVEIWHPTQRGQNK